MPASEVSPGFGFGVQPSGCADLEQAKACTPCLLRRSAPGFRYGVQPSGCADLEQAKACTPNLTVRFSGSAFRGSRGTCGVSRRARDTRTRTVNSLTCKIRATSL